MKNLLIEYINLLTEASRVREADITGGKKVPRGSKKHIADLERRIADNSEWRDKHPRGSEDRANYSRIINRLKAQLKSAKKIALKELSEGLIIEGGAVGHLMHLYDNPELTFEEIKGILSAASEGRLEKVSEKFDGMNIVISWDVEANDLRAARNSGDIKRGGMDAEQISAKFHGRGNVSDAFNNAFKVLRDAIGSLPDKIKVKVFGQNATIWYSAEVVYSSNPNVINYDGNSIVFHGWPVFETKDGAITNKEDADGVQILQSNIDKMQKAVTLRSWQVKGPALLTMKKLSDGSILSKTLSQIDGAMSAAGVSDGDTIQDYLISLMKDEVADLGLDEKAIDAVVARCVGIEGAPTLIAIKKIVPKEMFENVSAFVKNSPAFLKKFIQPIENAIHEFSIEALKGLQSTLVSDSDSEVVRLRAEVDKAVSAIEASGQDAAMNILKSQMQKLGSSENITASLEGVVFIYKGNAYKFTGAFAPINQILGLFKYGRGGIKIGQD